MSITHLRKGPSAHNMVHCDVCTQEDSLYLMHSLGNNVSLHRAEVK